LVHDLLQVLMLPKVLKLIVFQFEGETKLALLDPVIDEFLIVFKDLHKHWLTFKQLYDLFSFVLSQ
jgi:hypothetical protein